MKSWEPGCADEQWKTDICVRDARRTAEMVEFLQYVLGEPIEALTGAEIKAALKSYADSAAKSVENAGLEVPAAISYALARINNPTRQG